MFAKHVVASMPASFPWARLPGSSLLSKATQRRDLKAIERVDAEDARYCTIGKDMNFLPCS